MGITATELEVLKIIKDKNDIMSMNPAPIVKVYRGRTKVFKHISTQSNNRCGVKELSSKAGFEIGYTYMLCRSLEKQDCIGFFTPTSCRITARGKSLAR